MATTPRILAFAGSTRSDSYNKKLIRVAAAGARSAGAEVTLIDLREYPMPLYDGDLEQSEGLPESARRLRELMLSHQGLMIASPEYNSSISGVLKNAIDWTSRNEQGQGSLDCYMGKVAALYAASTGALGGLRGLVHVRAILGNIGVLVLPTQIAVMKAQDAFDGEGRLKDDKQRAGVEKLAAELAQTVGKLR